MRDDKENLIVKLSFDFALEILRCAKELQKSRDYSLADQLLRSGISIGANVREAQNAESKADFIHKMKIAAKEADEVEYYLQLILKSEYLDLQIYQLNKLNPSLKCCPKLFHLLNHHSAGIFKSPNLQIIKSACWIKTESQNVLRRK